MRLFVAALLAASPALAFAGYDSAPIKVWEIRGSFHQKTGETLKNAYFQSGQEKLSERDEKGEIIAEVTEQSLLETVSGKCYKATVKWTERRFTVHSSFVYSNPVTIGESSVELAPVQCK